VILRDRRGGGVGGTESTTAVQVPVELPVELAA
jgi:hypothetical protein